MTNVHVTRHITPYVGQTWKNERGEKNFLRQVVGVYRHSDNPSQYLTASSNPSSAVICSQYQLRAALNLII